MEADATGSARNDTRTSGRGALRAGAPHRRRRVGDEHPAINETGLSPRLDDIHNVYLQYATDLGFPGLILFLLIFLGA